MAQRNITGAHARGFDGAGAQVDVTAEGADAIWFSVGPLNIALFLM
jgi:hypothetical protein